MNQADHQALSSSQLEELAEQFLLLEVHDRPGLKNFSARLGALTDQLSADPHASLWTTALHGAAQWAGTLARGEAAEPAASFNAIGQTLLALQQVSQGCAPAQAGFPAELGLSLTGSEPAATGDSISDLDLARDFVAEAQEHFATADENLLILENEPANAAAIGAVFRAFHTIKGVVGFLRLQPIEDVAHAAEALLELVRNGEQPFAGRIVNATFQALDLLKAMIADLDQALVNNTKFLPRPEVAGVVALLEQVAVAPDTALDTAGLTAPTEIRQATSPTVKIGAERLDLLVEMIGELVIAESMVTQHPAMQALRSSQIESNLAHLGKITRQLQDISLAMRLVPIDATFRKMARVVRDVAHHAGKRVALNVAGHDTELDRAVMEKIYDSLVHMLRNAIDHGLESAAERLAAGKPATGQITLRAGQRGGNIQIQVADDGRGLDRAAILAKGIARGLVRADQKPTEQEIFSLIFEPGFSTAPQVTELSGRGVGMDVVLQNLTSLRGNVLIDTVRGRGTTFTLVLPLTTAIIDGIAVRVGREIYIVPTLSIIQSFKPTPSMISTVTGKGELIWFRDSLRPLFRLARLFEVSGAILDVCQATVMVVEEAGKQVALVVDELLGQQQTVIKSLGAYLGGVPGFSGASILADGRPGLILDVGGIVRLATAGVAAPAAAADEAEPEELIGAASAPGRWERNG